jgi:RND family efflux transporter MFP subunit
MSGGRFGKGRRGRPASSWAAGAAAIVLLASLSALPGGCGGREKAADAPGRSVVSGVEVATAEASLRERTAEAPGTVRAANIAVIAPQVMGTIASIPVSAGSRVEKGALLAAIDDAEIRARMAAAEGAVAEAEAALEEASRAVVQAEAGRTLAETTYERFRALHEERIVTRQEFDEVEAGRTVAVQEHERALHRRARAAAGIDRARAQADAARAALSHARVTAPFAGVVTEKRVDAGSMAAPGAPIVVLEDTRRYRLEASVPESRLGALRVGDRVRVALDAYPGKEIDGKVSEVAPAVDPATGTFAAKVDLPRDLAVRTGMFGRVRFPTGAETVVTVPREAVRLVGGDEELFAVGNDNVARRVIVKTGEAFDGRVEILSGIGPGTRVAVSPIDRLEDGARVEVAK